MKGHIISVEEGTLAGLLLTSADVNLVPVDMLRKVLGDDVEGALAKGNISLTLVRKGSEVISIHSHN